MNMTTAIWSVGAHQTLGPDCDEGVRTHKITGRFHLLESWTTRSCTMISGQRPGQMQVFLPRLAPLGDTMKATRYIPVMLV
jgi:hypothetical protein